MATQERSPDYVNHKRFIDLSTILGLISAFGLVGIAIVTGSGMEVFADVSSLAIVVGGTSGIILASYSFSELGSSFADVANVFLRTKFDFQKTCYVLIQMTKLARSKGIIALSNYTEVLGSSSPLLKSGITMLSDGMAVELIDSVMQNEIQMRQQQRAATIAMLRKAAEIAPSMGLIGTLVGLVQMLGSLEDPASIGPAMALALLTTFYGAVLGNLLFNPLANKLENIDESERIISQLYITAITSIAKLENPRRLEVLLNAILPPSERVKIFN